MPPVSVSGCSPAHKMLWDLSWPPVSPAPGPGQPQYYHQVASQTLKTSETSNSEQFTTNTRSHQRSNYCKTLLLTDVLSLHNTNIQTFVLFLGKPMFSPPGPVCVCGLLVIAYHARLGRCQHLMIEVVAADRSTSG